MNKMIRSEQNYIDSAYYHREPVTSRYETQKKKKYYLANINQSVETLKGEQVEELTKILIKLKSNYDQLIRDTLRKKQQTEQIGKQIEMLEKMEMKTRKKVYELEDSNKNISAIIEIKKAKCEEESFTRNTLIHLIQRMKQELLDLKTELNQHETQNKKLKRLVNKEKFHKTQIDNELNRIYSNAMNTADKNSFNQNENNLVLQYYKTIIDQKLTFMKSSDERKEKQIQIAQKAKNDTQDKQEVEKRKVLFLYRLYNKYLRRKMEKELKQNEELEDTFQRIKQITGIYDLKAIVEKILNKDRTYNLHVSTVYEKETRLDIVKQQNLALEEELKSLKSHIAGDSAEDDKNVQIEEEEEYNLIQEEDKLMQELKALQEKHEHVNLVYEKVTENIKNLIKCDKKNEETNISLNINNSSNLETQIANELNYNEEELTKVYKEYIANLKKGYESTLQNSKEEFIKAIMEKSLNEPEFENKKKSRVTTKSKNPATSRVRKSSQYGNNSEYNEMDEELLNEERLIKLESDIIANEYKERERQKLIERAKNDIKGDKR